MAWSIPAFVAPQLAKNWEFVHVLTEKGMGYIAIGDIHGCYNSLVNLLERIQPSKEDTVVFIGDYIDRGPNTKSVIDYLLEYKEDHACVFLRGNHEEMFLDYLAGDRSGIWESNGGVETLESYWALSSNSKIPQAHIDFIESTQLYLETDEFLFVHAGINPHFSIAENLELFDQDVFLWERSHLRNGSKLWEKTVVCGHTPQAQTLFKENLICIDTGCVFSHIPHLGNMTAIRLPERQVTSVAYSG